MSEITKMYRVKAFQSDECESTIHFVEYKILKETPKGYVIEFHRYSPKGPGTDTHTRWVPKEGKNPFAFTDKKLALINFNYRQKRHIELMKWKIEVCRKIRIVVKTMLETESFVRTMVSQYDDDTM